MKIIQREILLPAAGPGFHLITDIILQKLPELKTIKSGLINILIQHTSASLTLNENVDPDVRKDMESYFNISVKENEPYYLHTSEGSDDMPAHIKTSILGSTITLPVSDGMLALGTWQGIYLCEHRKNARRRKLFVTLMGE
ncbi:MAG: secondary thiamine-phosphate synthase enzyme YjbQ [Ignavibacteriaceae bacterium]